jgi:hypothetical protein
VTIKNLKIVGCTFGVQTNGGGSHTIYNDYIADCSDACVSLMGMCSFNNISYCTIDSLTAINMDYGSDYNTILENNLNGGVLVWLSNYETVDHNYWSDYSTKYPNATEIDHSGIGNQPYVYLTEQNGTQAVYYRDTHPIMKPISNPLMDSNPQTTVPEIPFLAILPLIIFVLLVAMFARQRKTSNLGK